MASEGAGHVVLKGSQEAGVVSEGEQEQAQQVEQVEQGSAGDDLAMVREVILRAHPDVVPELVRGSSVAELMASIEPARAAFQAVMERTKGSQVGGEDRGQEQVQAVPKVPAGGGMAPVNVDELPTSEKIKRGIAWVRR